MTGEREQKNNAYRLVRSALDRGSLVRPPACSVCGDTPPPTKDGRSKIQAHHHEGYDKPLSVQWLCTRCHMAVTPNLNTSNQNKGKTHCKNGHEYTPENTRMIRLGRQCRKCQKQFALAYKARRRASNAA